MHQVGAADVDHRVAPADEGEDPGVLQEAAEDAPHPDVLAEARHPRSHGADPADHDVDRHPGVAGAVERVDEGLVDDRVDLQPDPGRQPATGVDDLAVDEVEQALAHRAGRDEQALVRGPGGEARQLVEQHREVVGHLRVLGQQAEILVDPRRLGVVVAGADVAVPGQPARFLTHDEAELGVRLEPDDAVDDVDARVLELAGPRDVGLLVEAGLDLHQGQHLLAGLGGVDERVDDGAVPAGPVQRLLDRQHVRVGGGLLEERLHRGGEAVVGVVQQHVAPAEGAEDVAGLGRLHLVQVAVGAGQELGELQLGPVQVGHDRQPAQVQRLGQPVDLLGHHVQLAQQQLGVVVGRVVGQLQAHGRAEPATQQLPLQGLEQVLRVVLLHLQVLVAGDPERGVADHVHAGEQHRQVGGDHVLQRDERGPVVVVAVGVGHP